jgi:quercetin dioxygenase-like cupin family protein
MLTAEPWIECQNVYQVMGTRCQVLISGRQTDRTLATVLIETDAGGLGVPEHVHELEDETFHILSGRVRVTLGEREVIAGPGETVFGPRGQPHSWTALEPSRMVVSATPSGLEEMFAEIDALRERATPERVTDLCRRYGIEFARRTC